MQEVAALRYGFRRRISFVCFRAVPVSSPGRTPGFSFALAFPRLKKHGRAVVAFDALRRERDPIADRVLQVVPHEARGVRVAQVEDQPLSLPFLVPGVEAIGRHPGKGSEIVIPEFRGGLHVVFHVFVLDPAAESRNSCTILDQDREINKFFLSGKNLNSY